ncbi:thioesterase domain-containing protein [Micromonospora wenchangensis]|uniref:thioesterase domain-containing protein n=1 Tax=Micromonospora wenchangensis TaxID=1185415 RepID=UPI003D71CBCE
MNTVRDEPIGTGSLTGTGYERPRDPVEIWLARQWQRILGFGVGIRENFFGVGGNSLDAARVIDAILGEFGVQLPLNVLTEHPTVERLAAVLRDHDERPPGSLIAIQDGDGSHAPLFLVHPDDGQVGRYCLLANALGEEFAVFGLQAGGLHSDTQPSRTVPSMADAYVDAVRAVHPAGPYLLGGCGVGAAIAYEMAVRLEDVRLVAAIDVELLEPLDTVVESWSRELPRQAQLPEILADWQDRGLVPPNATPEIVARSLQVWQANREAARGWRPSPYTGPIDVFGREQSTILPATVAQRAHDCDTVDRLAAALRELIG